MAKNIVICCDGTGNQFGDHNSNVVKIFSSLSRSDKQQVLYYHPGVGTKGSMDVPTYLGLLRQKITKLHGLAYGYGVISNVAHAYTFLMDNFQEGDRLFLFGFSRGAYTVRVLCTMLYEFGLLDKGSQVLIEYAISLFTDSNMINSKIAQNFKKTFGRECSPYFVGVWDTVSSVGWLYDPLALAFTRENPGIQIGRHALAIDERRCFFRENLWQEADPKQDLKQVWFSGVHSDIGGGYHSEESGLSNISLQWMIDEAKQAGVLVDEEIVHRRCLRVPPNPDAPMHESLKGWWWIPEYLPKPYEVRIGDQYKKKWLVARGTYREIPEGSILHQSVLDRIHHPQNNYHPPNLPKDFRVEPWHKEDCAKAANKSVEKENHP